METEIKVDKKSPAATTKAVAKKVAETTTAATKKVAETAKKTADKVAQKAAEAKKTADAKKAAAKTTAAKKPARKAGRKVVKTKIVLEFRGNSFTPEDLIKNAKNVYRYDMKKKVSNIKTLDLYAKPEEGKVYFVVNGEEAGDYLL